MNLDEYRQHGKEMVDYIADYLENIRGRRVFPDVKPGYLKPLIPESAPTKGESWKDIFRDVERVIMPGMTHWQSPHMHAYFPALTSPPSMLGDMLADAIGCLGFTWASAPACTELEIIVMNWLGKMIGLPKEFLQTEDQKLGGGVIQTTASECTLVALLGARTEALQRLLTKEPHLDVSEAHGKLIGYCSEQAHSSVEKAGLIAMVKMRLVPVDDQLALRGDALRKAIEKDKAKGFVPFFVCGTLGTTGACAFDNIVEIGEVCQAEGLWLHLDAAYAGTSFICPEYRPLMAGIEKAHSFAFNPSKWMMVHFDCSAMWVKNSGALHKTFNVDPLYLKHENTGYAIDYMHWQLQLSKRFRALKLWFVIRSFGVEGLQRHVRKGVRLAKSFEQMVRKDERFELPAKRYLSLVCFRLKGEDALTEILLKRLNSQGRIHMVPASLKGKYVIRFTVTSQNTTEADIAHDWKLIQDAANLVLADENVVDGVEIVTETIPEEDNGQEAEQEVDENVAPSTTQADEPPTYSAAPWRRGNSVRLSQRRVSIPKLKFTFLYYQDVKRMTEDFGLSLMLSNVPGGPYDYKFINGTYVALFEEEERDNQKLFEYAKNFKRHSSAERHRGSLKLGDCKQMSLDMTGHDMTDGSGNGILDSSKSNRKNVCFKQGSLDSKIEDILGAGDNGVVKEPDAAKDPDGSNDANEDGGTDGHLSPSSGGSSASTSPNVIRAFGGAKEIRKTISKDFLMRTGQCPKCGHCISVAVEA